jgi:hypothetical protein
MDDSALSLFLLLGQTASRQVTIHPEVAGHLPLLLSESFDLASVTPDRVRKADEGAEVYRLFFVFENYLREMIIEVLSNDGKESWWDKLPSDVQKQISELEETEETKGWMALGSRDKSALMTYPQLLATIEHCWKSHFHDLLRDKALIQEARHISHLRNTTCHMSNVSTEELLRVRQIMRDWFRVVSP